MKYILFLSTLMLLVTCTPEKKAVSSTYNVSSLKEDINQSIVEGFYGDDSKKASSAYFVN